MSHFDRPFWNLGQVLAWVALRDRARIEQITDEGGVVALDCVFGDRSARELLLSCDESKRVVLEALQTDHLHARGRRKPDADFEVIPASSWLGLTLYSQGSGVDFEAAPQDLNRTGTRWYELKFQREEGTSLWERTGAIASVLPSVTAALSGVHIPLVASAIASSLPALTAALTDVSDSESMIAASTSPLTAALVGSNEASAASAQKTALRRRRKTSPELDTQLVSDIKLVLSRAESEYTRNPKLLQRQLARLLANPDPTKNKKLRYAEETIRLIIQGRYGPMIRLGIKSPLADRFGSH